MKFFVDVPHIDLLKSLAAPSAFKCLAFSMIAGAPLLLENMMSFFGYNDIKNLQPFNSVCNSVAAVLLELNSINMTITKFVSRIRGGYGIPEMLVESLFDVANGVVRTATKGEYGIPDA
jgi:hypothetical protein